MPNWMSLVWSAAIGAFTGILLICAAKRIVRKIPRYIVVVEYEGRFRDEPPMRHLFYIRGDDSLRGNENYAKQFWTERGARLAAAEFKLSDPIEEHHSFRFIQLRIVRIKGI